MSGIKDSDGEIVKEGDVVFFSYGIPPIAVEAPIIVIEGRLYASTPGHNPKRCLLSNLEEHVGDFTKCKPPGSYQLPDKGFP